ncbi:MAG: hypothetical protein HOQ22_05110, partial [Nocardioidaceae bacterium]|nr:hypothetical protein [Nocardioidaceae bacterium]
MTSTATLRRPAPPADPRLSELDLLDVSRLAEAVDAVVGPDLPVQRVRVEYLEYVPRSSLTVQLTAYVAGVALQGVVRTGAAADRAARATGTPLPGRDALLHWLPADPELPLLAWPTTRLRRLLGDRPRTGETPTVLAYVPGRRATLLLSPYVLKTYATAEDHANAVAGGLLLATGAALRTPRLLASLPGHRVTVQEQLEGVPAA